MLYWVERFPLVGFPLPQTPPPEFTMSTYYWDLYVLYIKNCERENYINDIDPNHYRMEWNHFWPRCIFGEWPVGQWLTLRQHAIVSALQTLVFKENCMCGWHKSYLPPALLELAWPYYCEASKNNRVKANVILHSKKDERGRSLLALKAAAIAHAGKNESGKSVNAAKGGAAGAAITSKRVLATFPDGSQRLFNSVMEIGRFLGVNDVAIRNRIKYGPSRTKSKLAGYRFEFA